MGVFSLMMCFNRLSQAAPISPHLAYAAKVRRLRVQLRMGLLGVGVPVERVVRILLFSALGYFFHPESGNNLLSCVCASAFLWLLVARVARREEAAGINVIVTIASSCRFRCSCCHRAAGQFDPAICGNFWRSGRARPARKSCPPDRARVGVHRHRRRRGHLGSRKYARDVGRAT
ncbi:MAG: hypothetical protein ACLT98_10570 [Eggerthellaceae bacterium]